MSCPANQPLLPVCFPHLNHYIQTVTQENVLFQTPAQLQLGSDLPAATEQLTDVSGMSADDARAVDDTRALGSLRITTCD